MHQLQAKTNELRDLVLSDLSKGREIIFSGLVENVEPARIPEDVFQEYFLPGFIGRHPDPQWVGRWISVAGTPSAEVAVFNPATGAELFRVPPFIASIHRILTGTSKGRISDVITHGENLSKNSPAVAFNFVSQALAQKSGEFVSQADQVYHGRWMAIFARYNVVPEGFAQPGVQSDSDDLFE